MSDDYNASNREAEMTAGSAWTTAPQEPPADWHHPGTGRAYPSEPPPDQSTSGSGNPPAAGTPTPGGTTGGATAGGGSEGAGSEGGGTISPVAGSPSDGLLGDIHLPNLGTDGLSTSPTGGTDSLLQPVVNVLGGDDSGSTGGSGTPNQGSDVQTNLVNDAVNLPATLLDGGSLDSGISHLAGDLLGTLGSPGGLVSDIIGGSGASNLVSGLVDGLDGGLSGTGDGSALQLAGTDGLLQPVLNVEDAAILDFHSELETLSHQTGTSDIIHALTNTGETAGLGTTGTTAPGADGETNLVTDALNLPSTTLGGGGLDAGISHIGDDLTNTANAADGIVNAALNGNDASNPLPELVNGLGGDLQTTPLVNLNGGNNAGDGGILGGTVGDINGSSNGHLVEADIGSSPNGSGNGIDVLAAPTAADHAIGLDAVDVGSGGPQLADVGLLTGSDTSGIPALGDTGLPALSGTGGLLGSGDGLITLNGGNNANDGGLAGGTVGASNGASGGHLVDADAGPNQDDNSVDVLAAPTGANHTADANVVDVGPNGPHLADLGVLTDPGTISIPALNGTGTDGLSGLTANLLGGTAEPGTAAPAPATTPVDLSHMQDILPGSITGDHGIIDVNGHHIV